MEYFGKKNFLEELIALRSDPLEASMIPMAMSELYNNGCDYDYNAFGENTIIPTPKDVPFEDYYSLQIDPQIFSNSSSFGEFLTPFDASLSSTPDLTDTLSNNTKIYTSTPFIPSQEDYNFLPSIERDNGQVILANALQDDLERNIMEVGQCKVEQMEVVGVMQSSSTEGEIPTTFNVGISNSERINKSKKLNGHPSKNLMAERRRRKRLNDRLSMLRSVVPKISKMDRTSILGDTIDYIKEMLERINRLQEEMDQEGPNPIHTLMNTFHNVNKSSNEVLVRNSPKFNVERRNTDTRIAICCAVKPGLLLSTVTTLEALGIDIEQCTISCFNDFSIQASCSEEAVERGVVTSEDLKQALFRNAGYCGTCL